MAERFLACQEENVPHELASKTSNLEMHFSNPLEFLSTFI
jgi:hypothetical protein